MANNLALQILIQAKDAASAVIGKVKDTISGASNETGVFGRASSALTGTLGLLSGALASIGFGAFLKKTIDAADALDELSQKTGVSVRALAGLQRLPDLAEVPIENVGKAINKLSIYMANNAEAALQMGISAKDPVEALYQFADVFANTESAQERAALGAKVLGKSYADLAPILLQGGDALRSQTDAYADQAGVTQEMAARAGELNDKLHDLNTAGQDFLTRAVLPAIAPLSELVKYFGELFFATDKATQSASGATQVYTFIAKTMAGVGFVVDTVGRSIGAMGAKLAALGDLDFKGIQNIDKAYWEDTARSAEKFAKAIDNIENPKTKEKTKSAPAQMTDDVEIALKKFEEWGTASKTVTEGVAAGLQKLTDVELRELKATLEDAFTSGKKGGQDLQDALAQIKTEELSRAWKTLGQESSQSLKKTAEDAKQAYIAIRDSGTASAGDLEKAWEAVEKKILAANAAANTASEADKQRQQNLKELDQIGADPKEQAYNRHKEITEQTIAFDKAMRQGDYAEAARIAQEKEQLAADSAKADAEAAAAGEIADYNRYDGKQRYLRAIEDTKKALEALKQVEQGGNVETQDQQPQDGQEPKKDPQIQKLETITELKKQIAEPVELTVKIINFDEAMAQFAELAQAKAGLDAKNGTVTTQTTAAATATVDEALSTEVLKRGSRR